MARLSLHAAARLCGKSRTTLYRAIARGALPRDSQGRIDTEDLLRLGYLSRAQAEEPIPPQPPPSQHTRLTDAIARLEALATTLADLIAQLRTHTPQRPPQ